MIDDKPHERAEREQVHVQKCECGTTDVIDKTSGPWFDSRCLNLRAAVQRALDEREAATWMKAAHTSPREIVYRQEAAEARAIGDDDDDK